MKWRKQGLIFDPSDYCNHPLLVSHAANPIAIHLQDSVFRILYSGRDIWNRSSIGSFDFDLHTRRILDVCKKPLFTFGPKGTFYQSGVSIGCVYKKSSVLYILFMGWQTSQAQHWRGDIGRLKINSHFNLELCPEVPFIGMSSVDPISLSYPWVIGDDSSGFTMLYGSTLSWDSENGEMIHVLNEAISDDGENWKFKGLAVPYQLGVAQAFSRPTVWADKHESQHLWFSYRSGTGTPYLIGYANKAVSSDKWELYLTGSGIEPSESGWDSQMIEYPYVFEHNDTVYMLYNGNSFGKTGIGMAILER